jgi:hypothetical protein
MANVQNLKELLGFVFELGESIGESFEDGKITFMDAANFVDVFQKIAPALEDIDMIPAEISDIDEAEINELTSYISEEFDIADDELEMKLEMGLEAGLRLAKFIGIFIK